MPKLILIRGIPGSGKSTIAHSLATSNAFTAWFEADHFFMKDGVYKFDSLRLMDAHQWCWNAAKEALQQGFDVIVSNTFTTEKEIQKYRELAKDIPNVSVQEIICMGDFGTTHGVPEVAMKKYRERAWWLKK